MVDRFAFYWPEWERRFTPFSARNGTGANGVVGIYDDKLISPGTGSIVPCLADLMIRVYAPYRKRNGR